MTGKHRSRCFHSFRMSILAGIPLAVLGLALLGFRTTPAETAEPPIQKEQSSKSQLVMAHETTLTASQEFIAGSQAAIRCGVHGVKSLSETVPLAGARVDVRLRSKDGKVLPLDSQKTGADGIAEARFRVPLLPAGQYVLMVTTKSDQGEEKLEREVRIKTDAKILLVTDKPLYQPGQVIHIRALSLQPFDLTPVGGKDLTFEVEDAKSNKVFKRTHKTSDFGVAAVDFQLADEVNMGEYHVRAILGEQQADKTVTVKRYVLPKFKVELTADKRYYLPRETLHADLQTDYFFGKPVSEGKVKVTASTFDVQFRDFQTWEGKIDKNGHAKFEIKLPDYFVGQPLQKGNALVRLEVKVTDTADHVETINLTYPVSEQPIQVSLIPEGGRLVPDMDNRVFAAAIYPDGSPAACQVHLWLGKEAKGKPFAAVKTNEAGLAEFTVKPKADQLRQGQWEQRNVEMLGGNRPIFAPKILMDLFAEAKDDKGNAARASAEVNSDPLGENVLLRLDKAIYRGGEAMKVDIRTSAGLPTTYLDVVKSGQTLLTRWLDVKNGKAGYRLDLPASIFGTLEVHAYQILASGEIIRDSRVVYVHPAADLKVEVTADKDVHLPGEEGRIRFQVTDAAGQPTAAALGVIVVDEAVYALQEMQPGLEKVYFTLQQELIKPQAQAIYRPAESIDGLVREPVLGESKQQIAQVLLTSVKPKPPALWEVSPVIERRNKVEGQLQQIGWALFNYAANDSAYMRFDQKADRWIFSPGLLETVAKNNGWQAAFMNDPFGKRWTLEELARLEKGFRVDELARAVTYHHAQQLTWMLINYSNLHQAEWFKNGKWNFPETILADLAKTQKQQEKWFKDAWGRPFKLVQRDKKREHQTGWTQLDFHDLVSAGPDGKFGTPDDVTWLDPTQWHLAQWWWLQKNKALGLQDHWGRRELGMMRGNNAMLGAGQGAIFFGMDGATKAQARMLNAPHGGAFPAELAKADSKTGALPASGSGGGSAAPPMRVREYFPETMLWQPILITDDKGRADLKVNFADSITTWRLTASASSRAGSLGGVSAPLRVFQDFFVDLDLPVSLTQNDEVAFPVAVYNYLKTPQTVTLNLQPEPWFDLVDQRGIRRSLDLRPNEVTSVKFRIRAKKIGQHPLTVKAAGTKMSDAIKRTIEVVPDGQKVERVFTDRLTARIAQTIDIPEHAIPDSYKLLVKIYPGVLSQVLEGTEGMLRLPGG